MALAALAVLLAGVTLEGSAPASEGLSRPEPLPGRVLTLSVGGAANGAFGHTTVRPPLLARLSPELQVGWGIRIGESFLLTTRLSILGGIVPVFPTGLAAEVAVSYLPLTSASPIKPLVRFSSGAFLFGSGGEVAGPDYQAYGFRMALEGGFVHLTRVPGASPASGSPRARRRSASPTCAPAAPAPTAATCCSARASASRRCSCSESLGGPARHVVGASLTWSA